MAGRNKVPGGRSRIPGGPSKVPGAPNRVPGFNAGNHITKVPAMSGGGYIRSSKDFASMHRGQLRNAAGRYSGTHGVAWQGLGSIEDGIIDWHSKLLQGVERGAENLAQAMEDYAKANRPWTDRTTDAREGLQAHVVNESGGRYSIWLGHGADVDYGIWLEVRWGGKFAIILPTLYKFAPQLGSYIKAAS